MSDQKLAILADEVEKAKSALLYASLALGDYQVKKLKSVFGYSVGRSVTDEFEIVITVYDIPKDDVESVKKQVRLTLDDKGIRTNFLTFIRVYSHDDTAKYYPQFLKGTPSC